MIFAKMEIAIWEIIITILNIQLEIGTIMKYIGIMVYKNKIQKVLEKHFESRDAF